jgi:hypothetical protein
MKLCVLSAVTLASLAAACGGTPDERAGAVSEAVVAPPSCTNLTLAAGRIRPGAIASDGTHVYWGEAGANGAPYGGTIIEVPVGGGKATTVAVGQAPPWAIAVDDANVYWIDEGTQTAGLLDGAVLRLSKLGGLPVPLAVGQYAPQGIAVDAASVYYTAGPAVLAIDKLGGVPLTLALGQTPAPIAVDTYSVYYGDATPLSGAQTIDVVSKLGGVPFVLASKAQPIALAVDTDFVYWRNFWDGTLVRLAKAGGKPATLVTGIGGFGSIAVDRAYVYYTTATAVMAVPIGGGAQKTVATTATFAQHLAVDDHRVYFTTQSTTATDGSDDADGLVVAACKPL